MYTGVIPNIHIHVWTSPTSARPCRPVSAQPPHAHTMPLSGLGTRSVPCARRGAGPPQGQRFPGRAAAASLVSAGDFLLLLCASQQWQVFLAERTEEWQHVAGVNTDHLEPLRGEPNPVPNFIHCRWVPGCRQPAEPSLGLPRRRGCRADGSTWLRLGRSPGQVLRVVSGARRGADVDLAAEGPPGVPRARGCGGRWVTGPQRLPARRSYLDMLKVAVFRYLFWLVLVVVFITGATRISVFGLGYLLACFYLLLFGTSLLQKETRTRLVLWDCLILYNVTVIISKNMLSVSRPACPAPAPAPNPIRRLADPPPTPSSCPVSSWSKCRAASAGSSSCSASCARSKATMTVSGRGQVAGGVRDTHCFRGPDPCPFPTPLPHGLDLHPDPQQMCLTPCL